MYPEQAADTERRIPVTPVEILEKMTEPYPPRAHQPYPLIQEPYRDAAPEAVFQVPSAAATAAAATPSPSLLTELKHIKYLLIAIVVLMFLLLILRR